VLFAGCSGTTSAVNPADLEGFDCLELPLTFAGPDNHFSVVTARIQGHAFRLMLDTADYAAFSLTPGALNKLDVKITGKRSYRDMTGRRFCSRKFIVPSMQLGTLTLTQVPGRENVNGPPQYDGTIGRALLAGFYTLIDYPHKTLTLYKKDREPPCLRGQGWFRYDCKREMQFKVRLEGLARDYWIGLDSGTGLTFVPRDSELGRAMRSALKPTRVTEGSVNNVPADDLRFYEIGRVTLDGYDIGRMACLVGPAARYMGNGLMGFDFLASNRVLVDFATQTVWLRKAE